jgi:hypothetical protein
MDSQMKWLFWRETEEERTERLRIDLAGLKARRDSIRDLMPLLTRYPVRLLDEVFDLDQAIAELAARIEKK